MTPLELATHFNNAQVGGAKRFRGVNASTV